MRQILKDVGIYLVLLLVVTGGVWIYNHYKEDVLDYSLDVLGKKLLAMAPGEQEKASIRKIYKKFRNEVRERKVESEQVETVAANILNLSHSNARLSPDQVRAVLYLKEIPRLPIAAADSTSPGGGEAIAAGAATSGEGGGLKMDDFPTIVVADIPEVPEMRGLALSAGGKISPQELEGLGERLKSMCEFNEELESTLESDTGKRAALRYHLQYLGKNGLKIMIDPALKEQLPEIELKKLNAALHKLKKARLLEWRKELPRELARERRRITRELVSLQMLQQAPQIKGLDKLKALEQLEKLKELEAQRYSLVIKSDSLARMVRKRIEINLRKRLKK